MPGRKTQSSEDDVPMSRTRYDAMVKVMIELTWRGPQPEALMMRVAKAGGVSDVTNHIMKMRKYAKRHADAKQGTLLPDDDSDGVQPTITTKKRTGKKGTRRLSKHTQASTAAEGYDESGQATT